MSQQLNILILNGPNLGVLGQREPEIYGKNRPEELPDLLKKIIGQRADQINLSFFQSNKEGELIDKLEQSLHDGIQGVVFNAGALTHTSLALADCLSWIPIPCIEVHLSNIWSREEKIRHTSMIAKNCLGVIAGFGLMSYALAVLELMEILEEQDSN